MNIYDLRCENLIAPLGLDCVAPRLSWKLGSSAPGARQSACRVQCCAAPDFGELLWDSGRLESGQTSLDYAGPSLGSRQRVFWRVEAEDENGATAQSQSAHWEIGLLDRADWTAQWIEAEAGGSVAPFWRRAFALDKPVRSARLYASALGVYDAFLNGRKIGDIELAPGWTDYRQRVQVQTYDVTALLQPGQNALGAVVGMGWCCGRLAWHQNAYYRARPAFLGQLEIEFEDGTRQTLASDASWQWAGGPIQSNDLLSGTHYDARLELSAWCRAEFDAAPWQSAAVISWPDGLQVSAPRCPPVRATQQLTPIRAPHAVQDGEWHGQIFDLGQNFIGRVRLTVRGQAGQTVRLRHAETLQDGPKATTGELYLTNLRGASATDFYVCRGEAEGGGVAEETFEPPFTFHGFRFVEVSGHNFMPEIVEVTGVVLHSDLARVGNFECSDALVNQLQQNIDWGWRGNSLDIPTDCPQRDERLGWTGDAQVFASTALWNRDCAGFWADWLRKMRDDQLPDGGIPCVIPDVGVIRAAGSETDSFDGGPAWSDAAVFVPWDVYRASGDARVLRENYAMMTRYLAFLEKTARDFVRPVKDWEHHPGFGDWLAMDNADFGTDGATPKDLLGTAFFARSATLLSRCAAVLGEEADARRLASLAHNVREAFNRDFVRDGVVGIGNQSATVLALAFEMLPEAQRAQAAAHLAARIEANGVKLTTGFATASLLPHVLSDHGYHELAGRLLFQQQWPSWLYAVTQGATTIWERWNGWTHDQGFADAGMNSFNHYAYGAIGDWLYHVVAGIQLDPEVPGYARFVLEPRPIAQLSFARAHLESPHGRIESEWHRENQTLRYRFVVPPNTSAQIRLPNGQTRDAGAGVHQGEIEMELATPAV